MFFRSSNVTQLAIWFCTEVGVHLKFNCATSAEDLKSAEVVSLSLTLSVPMKPLGT